MTQPVPAVLRRWHSRDGLCHFPPRRRFVQADCRNRIITRVLDDGRVAVRPDGSASETISLPENLLAED